LERNYNFQGQEFQTKEHFTLDGMECENTGWMETIIKSTAIRDRKTKTITINSKAQMQDGGEAIIVQKFFMDDQNLVIEASMSSSYGEMEERYVFDN